MANHEGGIIYSSDPLKNPYLKRGKEGQACNRNSRINVRCNNGENSHQEKGKSNRLQMPSPFMVNEPLLNKKNKKLT